MDRNYKGWKITYDPAAPITGRWRATRYGVGMCTNTEEGLRSMIDFEVENAHRPWLNFPEQNKKVR